MHLERSFAEKQRQDCRRLIGRGEFREAVNLYFALLEETPDDVELWHNLGFALLNSGLAEQALVAYSKARALAPDMEPALVSLFMAGWNSRSQSAEENAQLHQEWGRRFCQATGQLRGTRGSQDNRVLRLGYVSSNFAADPEHAFLHGPLRHHDRSRFQVFCYSSTIRADRQTAKLREIADEWRDIQELSDQDAARLVLKDRIDVLVDCSGHFRRTRLGIFAYRPARVHVSFPTYPASTGLNAIDFRITDAVADPAEHASSLCTEKLIRLPGTSLCYQPLAARRPLAPVKSGQSVTFGCLQRRSKITMEALAAWVRILRQAPHSRLILQYAHSPDVIRGLERWREQAQLDASRVVITGTLSKKKRDQLLGEVDIILDTFPYNGTATTSEALCMGIPVVALAGDSFVSRMGASLIAAAGLSGWTATTLDEYESIATEWANNLDRLRKAQAFLRGKVRASALSDARRYTAELESAYLEMLQAVERKPDA